MKENVKYISNDVSKYTVLMVVESADARSLMSFSKIPSRPLLWFLLNQLNRIGATIRKMKKKKNKPIYTSKSHSIIQPKNLIDPTQFAFINNKNNDYCMIFRKCMKWKTKKNNKKLPDNIQTIEFKYLPNDFDSVEFFIWEEKGKKTPNKKWATKKHKHEQRQRQNNRINILYANCRKIVS